MKYVMLLFITSCALSPKAPVHKAPTYFKLMKACIVELIGQHGVKPSVAKEVCKDIHNR